eukprot:2649950-Rhodomonas_salina.3
MHYLSHYLPHPMRPSALPRTLLPIHTTSLKITPRSSITDTADMECGGTSIVREKMDTADDLGRTPAWIVARARWTGNFAVILCRKDSANDVR